MTEPLRGDHDDDHDGNDDDHRDCHDHDHRDCHDGNDDDDDDGDDDGLQLVNPSSHWAQIYGLLYLFSLD